MKLIYKKLKDIKQYENSPRKNDDAVKYVAESIKEFGFKVHIVIDKEGVIVAGQQDYDLPSRHNIKLNFMLEECGQIYNHFHINY